nr:hypothetical protein [Steroidobacter cummioxidans]
MKGDAVDDADDFSDARGGAGYLIHRREQLAHHLATANRHVGGLRCQRCSLMRAVAIAGDGRCQLFERCGGLFEAGGMFAGAIRQLGVRVHDLHHAGLHVGGGGHVVFQHAIHFDSHLLERFRDRDDARHAGNWNSRMRVAAEQLEDRAMQFQQGLHHIRLNVEHVGECDGGSEEAEIGHPSEAEGGCTDDAHGEQHCTQRADDSPRANAQRGIQCTLQAAKPGSIEDAAFADAQTARAIFADGGISLLCLLDFDARWFDAHRHVADDFAALIVDHRRDVGSHPIEAAVLAAILHQAGPGLARTDGAPQIGERLLGHVGMTNEVLRLTQALLERVLAAGQECAVCIGDPTRRVGVRDDDFTIRKHVFHVAHSITHSHDVISSAQGTLRCVGSDRADLIGIPHISGDA